MAIVAGCADRYRLLTPLGKAGQGQRAVHVQHDAAAQTWFWQHFERHLGQQPQAAETACHQARNVVACDVLHDFSAETQVLAKTGDDPCAQHEITHRPAPRAARSRKPRSDHTAERRSAKVWRFARQHLACGVQCLDQLAQWRAGARSNHQLCRVISDDAPVLAGIEYFASGFTTERSLAVAALKT